MCSPATRGIWIDLICAMWENEESGEIEGTVVQLARAVACFPEEMETALYELSETGAADVSARDICVTRHAKLIESNVVVTVVNRRMSRGEKAKQGARLRQQRKRQRDGGHAAVTENSRSPSSSSSSTSVTGTNVPAADAAKVVSQHDSTNGPPDPLDVIWKTGAHLLTASGIAEVTARSFLGMLCKQHGDIAVAEKIAALAVKPVADPRSWLKGALNGAHRESRPESAAARVDAANPSKPNVAAGHRF